MSAVKITRALDPVRTGSAWEQDVVFTLADKVTPQAAWAGCSAEVVLSPKSPVLAVQYAFRVGAEHVAVGATDARVQIRVPADITAVYRPADYNIEINRIDGADERFPAALGSIEVQQGLAQIVADEVVLPSPTGAGGAGTIIVAALGSTVATGSGPSGRSAWQVAVANGFEGTEAEYAARPLNAADAADEVREATDAVRAATLTAKGAAESATAAAIEKTEEAEAVRAATDGVRAATDQLRQDTLVVKGQAEAATAAANLARNAAAFKAVYATYAELDADKDHDEKTFGWVFNDPALANNGTYVKVGASGSGSWEPQETAASVALQPMAPESGYMLGLAAGNKIIAAVRSSLSTVGPAGEVVLFRVALPATSVGLSQLSDTVTGQLLPEALTNKLQALPLEAGWAFGVGADGGKAVGFRRDGTIVGKYVVPAESISLPQLASAVVDQLLPEALAGKISSPRAEAGWAFGVGTPGGKAVGFRRDGTIVGKLPPELLASLLTALNYTRTVGARVVPLFASDAVVVSLGDSTAAGAGATVSANRWLNRLAAATGAAIVNLGIGAQRHDEIAGRFDAIPVTITLAGNSIPADTSSVSVTAISPALLYNGSGTTPLALKLEIAGVMGTLTGVGTTGYTWARDAAGSSVAISAGQAAHPQAGALYQDSILFLCMGTNSRADPYGVIKYMRAVGERMRPYFRAIFYVSPRNFSDETPSSSGAQLTNYKGIRTIERMGPKVFGAAWIDLRRFLIDDALQTLAYLGLGPTRDAGQIATDDADIANDVIPTSLRADIVHSNDYGHRAEEYLFTSILKSRGLL